MTTIVTAGENKNFTLGPSYFPGAPSPDTLDLRVEAQGQAFVVIATNNDPNATSRLVADGGKITADVASHMTDLGTVDAMNGGNVSFFDNFESSFTNNGTSVAASGGSITVPISVIGKGLFLIEPHSTMTFASAFDPTNVFTRASVAATQSVVDRGGTLVIDYLPGFKAPVRMGPNSVIDINNFTADSATYDAKAHLVDFVSGGKTVATLALTLTNRHTSLDIAKTASGFTLTDPMTSSHIAGGIAFHVG